ncbi:MAG: nucleotidyltransferase family protein [Gammaproteobacteria bacterium]|nr:nucleotidyltransferase family protein [Gammaproteobacteria bacterium]MYD80816.1 nucleotidyltransferase family protein [Gammaproteobacteria bacterium]
MQNTVLKRNEILSVLRTHKKVLMERFGVAELAIFGSFARDEAENGSDLDILVRFNGRSTFKGYFGTQFYIEDLLGVEVDLVTDTSLRSELRPYIEQELVRV